MKKHFQEIERQKALNNPDYQPISWFNDTPNINKIENKSSYKRTFKKSKWSKRTARNK